MSRAYYQKVDFNIVKRFTREVCQAIGLNINNLNLDRICAYQPKEGFELNASTRSRGYEKFYPGVTDPDLLLFFMSGYSRYEIFEIPFITNTEKEYGKFLIISMDKTYIAGVSISDITRNRVFHNVQGYFDCVKTGDSVHIIKKRSPVYPAGCLRTELIDSKPFDYNHTRKNAYRTLTR